MLFGLKHMVQQLGVCVFAVVAQMLWVDVYATQFDICMSYYTFLALSDVKLYWHTYFSLNFFKCKNSFMVTLSFFWST